MLELNCFCLYIGEKGKILSGGVVRDSANCSRAFAFTKIVNFVKDTVIPKIKELIQKWKEM